MSRSKFLVIDQDIFELHRVKKGQIGLAGFDDKILALYVRDVITQAIQAHLQELHRMEFLSMLISKVT
jgi:putative transposase